MRWAVLAAVAALLLAGCDGDGDDGDDRVAAACAAASDAADDLGSVLKARDEDVSSSERGAAGGQFSSALNALADRLADSGDDELEAVAVRDVVAALGDDDGLLQVVERCDEVGHDVELTDDVEEYLRAR